MAAIDEQSQLMGEMSAKIEALAEGQRDLWASMRGLHETVLRINTTVDILARAMKEIEPIVKHYSQNQSRITGLAWVVAILAAVFFFFNDKVVALAKLFMK